MTNFIPTEEQILDYHLGKTQPEISRAIAAYLQEHADQARILKEWADLEASFAQFPLKSPKEDVLNRVRLMAREEMNAHSGKTIFEKILTALTFRQWALALSLVVVVLFSLTLRQSENSRSARGVSVEKNYLKATRTSADKNKNAETTEATDTLEAALFGEYNQALDNYHAGNFKEAHKTFSHIMTENPAFAKREELYTYWVETLKKLGRYELAVKKQQILEEIQGQ